MKQRSDEWFRARCGRITGSRFALAMSGRKTRAYQGLVDMLVHERITGCAERSRPNDAMQWGIDHEAGARSWYARSSHVPVRVIGFVVHPQFDYVGVSPDGLVANDGMIEIKCPQLRNFNYVASSGCMPARYRWQIQGQLWVCQREWVDFVCFYPPGRGVIIREYPDPADFCALAERCTEIHAEVERRLRLPSNLARSAPVSVGLAEEHSKDIESKPDYARWWVAAAIIVAILYFLSR